jgi:hypothetical protein
MPSPHAYATATRLDDGSVAVAGGVPDFGRVVFTPTADVDRYDPASGQWSRLPDLPEARFQSASTLLDDGSMLVAGGSLGAAGTSSETVRLRPGAASWETVPAPPVEGSFPAIEPLPSGRLGIFAAATVVLDPADGRAASVAPSNVGSFSASAALGDGSVLVTKAGQAFERFTATAAATVAPQSFGEQTSGRPGAVVNVPVTAASQVPLFVDGATVEGPDAADFTIVSDSCAGAALELRQSCFVGVRFTPGADGDRSASLVVGARGLPGGRASAPLSGTGVAAASGPAGPQGPAGARGPAGKPAKQKPAAAAAAAQVPRVRCAGTKRRVTCTGLTARYGKGRVRLIRNGVVFATGTIRNGRLTLSARRPLSTRRYTLSVVHGRRASKVAVTVRG